MCTTISRVFMQYCSFLQYRGAAPLSLLLYPVGLQPLHGNYYVIVYCISLLFIFACYTQVWLCLETRIPTHQKLNVHIYTVHLHVLACYILWTLSAGYIWVWVYGSSIPASGAVSVSPIKRWLLLLWYEACPSLWYNYDNTDGALGVLHRTLCVS